MSLNLSFGYSDFCLPMAKSLVHKSYEFERFRLDAAYLMLCRGDAEMLLPPKAAMIRIMTMRRTMRSFRAQTIRPSLTPATTATNPQITLSSK